MKVAAYQAPLLEAGSMDALDLIRMQVRRCEGKSVAILCCPEAILGGLADYAEHPTQFAIRADQLNVLLAPIVSDTVTTIVGFTELSENGRIYNSAAIFHRGSTVGVYRKLRPAINKSVYEAGVDVPVFQVRGLTFGILICNDSNYSEPARIMSARGAKALFVPSNNSLPMARTGANVGSEVVSASRNCDIARAVENGIWVIRADVAGATSHLLAHGSSAIVDPVGRIVQSAPPLSEELVVAEIATV